MLFQEKGHSFDKRVTFLKHLKREQHYAIINIDSIGNWRVCRQTDMFILATRNRGQNMQCRATGDRCVKAQHIANVFTIQKDIDKRTELACFVT